jgi:hypothetical protein
LVSHGATFIVAMQWVVVPAWGGDGKKQCDGEKSFAWLWQVQAVKLLLVRRGGRSAEIAPNQPWGDGDHRPVGSAQVKILLRNELERHG